MRSPALENSSRLALIGLFFWGVLCVFSPSARADAARDARAAFERGVAASRAGRWDEARHEFQASRDLVVKPSTLFNLAVADIKLGLGGEALLALDAFERLASPVEHAAMLARAGALRADAERLEESARPAGERVHTLIEPTGLVPAQRELFEQGREAFARGDDKQALDAFSHAYQQSSRAELWYDIGVVCDRLREDERAIDAFRRFVAELPDAPEAELARRRIERLEQVLNEKGQPTPALAVAESSEPPAATGADQPASPPSPARLGAPRGLLVLGALLAAASVGPALWWADRNSAIDTCRTHSPRCDNLDQLKGQRNGAIALTLVLDAGALALLGGGGTWLAKRKRAARIDAALPRTGRGLSLGLRLAF